MIGGQWVAGRSVSGSETATIRTSAAVDLSEASFGEYGVSLALGDEELEAVTWAGGGFPFDVVPPLGRLQVELVDYSPRELAVGGQARTTLEFENRTDRDSAIVSSFGYTDLETGVTWRLGVEYRWVVPTDETVTHVFPKMGLTELGHDELALPDVDISLTVADSESCPKRYADEFTGAGRHHVETGSGFGRSVDVLL